MTSYRLLNPVKRVYSFDFHKYRPQHHRISPETFTSRPYEFRRTGQPASCRVRPATYAGPTWRPEILSRNRDQLSLSWRFNGQGDQLCCHGRGVGAFRHAWFLRSCRSTVFCRGSSCGQAVGLRFPLRFQPDTFTKRTGPGGSSCRTVHPQERSPGGGIRISGPDAAAGPLPHPRHPPRR